MADWNNPLLTTKYDVFLAECKERDVDSATMFKDIPIAPPTGAVQMNRLGASKIKFSEWSGSAFAPVTLDVAGGGTGGVDGPTARANLGLGSMATQNANQVGITGGGIVGLIQFSVNASIQAGTGLSYDIGSNGLPFRRAYIKGALVIPVGPDKYATS